MTKILITGSSGMIAFHLIKKLSELKKFDLYGVDKDFNSSLKATYSSERINFLKRHNPDITFINLDLCDDLLSEKINELKPEIIVHLAADAGILESFKNPQKILLNNNISFIKLLDSIRNTNLNIKLLYASSSSVYGKTTQLQIETNNELMPTSSYGLSKLMNEHTADLYYKNYGIKSVGLRFFTVYGEYNRKDMLMHYLLESFYHNKEVKLYNNGLMERDFTYAGDVANSILSFIECEEYVGHEVFNIGGTGASTLNNIVSIMSKNFTHNPNIKYENFIPTYDPLRTFCNNNKLLKKFPELKFTPLEVGIDNLLSWYKNYLSN